MAEGPRKPGAGTPSDSPFGTGEDEWASELDAWDAALPIVGEPKRRRPVPVSARADTDTTRPVSAPPTATADDDAGAVPEEEVAFFETPTTVVSNAAPYDIDDLPELATADALGDSFDEKTGRSFDEGIPPSSTAYAAIIASGQGEPSLFDRDPAREDPPPFPGDTLPEMAPGPWRDEPERMVAVPAEGIASTMPGAVYWEVVADVIADERRFAVNTERKISLALGAGRVAERLGRGDEAWICVGEALTIDTAAPVAHRARLTLAERLGKLEDPAVGDSLARLAGVAHPDQSYYRALYAEWTLARGPGLSPKEVGVDAPPAALVDVQALPEGLARILAQAELAWRKPGLAAGLLEEAAHRTGGALGAALLAEAARLSEAGGNFKAAAEQRFFAAGLDPKRPPGLGLLRDLARQDLSAQLRGLGELLSRVSASALRVSLARWAASLARRSGDLGEARRYLTAPVADGPDSPALARDRLDLAGPARRGEMTASAMLQATMGHWSTKVAEACGALRACELTRTAEADMYPLALIAVQRALTATPDAVAVAVAAEDLAGQAPAAEARARALGFWRDGDPARRVPAILDLADAKLGLGDVEAFEKLLADVRQEEPRLSTFWQLAVRAVGAGRAAEAATLFKRGAETWQGSAIGPALRERAAELRARENPLVAIARLEALAKDAADPLGARLSLERVLRRLGPANRWMEHAREEAARGGGEPGGGDAATGAPERDRRAALLVEVALGNEDSPDADVDSALALVPLHPAALALTLRRKDAPQVFGERLADGARRSGDGGWLLAAAAWAATHGAMRRALALTLEAWDMGGTGRGAKGKGGIGSAARKLARRLVWAAETPEHHRGVYLRLASAEGANPPAAEAAVEAAEVEESSDNATAAYRLFEVAGGAPELAADIRVGLWRTRGAPLRDRARGVSRRARTLLSAAMPSPSEPAPPLRAEVPDAEAAARDERGDEAQDRLAPLGEAAAAGRWAEVALRLAEAPPHEASAGGATLLLSAMLDEARADGSGARRWLEEAGKAGELPALVRAVDRADVGAGAAVRAHDRLARAAFDIGDERSAALFLVEAARLAGQEGIGDGDGAERDRIGVDERLLEAAARDPASIPAAMARRRWLLGTDRLDEAATVLEQEAAALLDPGLRVRALMRAAAVVLAVAPGASDAARADRAAGILRRALEMAPGDQQVFTELRDLYEAARRPEALVALFEERIHATPNPFEITSLRLARAEIFAGPLANRAAAKAELAAVLAKEPQHARAVASLADLELADGNDAAAAELYIRRAWSERSPEKLRELFLRLGRIYTGRLPDSKRAVGAYARVLQLDGNNREALDALSRLYLGLGETKNAVAITERLVRLETVPERRAGYLVRLGQLSERAGDPRAAAGYFRRAVEAAPRSLEALGELARFLEKSRDVTGRKALLDETAEELRAAVHASPGDRAALEALAAVLRWRGRTEAAAAATDLVRLFFAETGGERPLLPPHGGRRLAALTYPAADELTFPASVPPAVRQLFLMLGEVLGLGGRPDLRQVGVDRVDRVPPGKPPRDVFDTVAAELGSPAFDLYVRPARDTGEVAPLVVLPGQPAAVVIDARVAQLGGTALRFAAARTGRLLATHLDLALAGDPAGLGAWLGGVIRQFVPDFQLPGVSPSAIAEQASRAAKHLSRKLRQEVMPFAMESSGALDLDALRAGIQDGVNRVGLIASGSAAAALRVILTAAGAPIGAASVRRIPEAQALLEFALSDEHDDLVRALD